MTIEPKDLGVTRAGQSILTGESDARWSLCGRPLYVGAIDPTEFRLAPVGAESTDHTAGGEE